MAVKSGMIYERIIDLCSELTNKATAINGIFDEMMTTRVSEIAAYYDGEAAESFKTNLKNISERVQEDINSIITKIREEADVQKAAYTSQDDRLTDTM